MTLGKLEVAEVAKVAGALGVEDDDVEEEALRGVSAGQSEPASSGGVQSMISK